MQDHDVVIDSTQKPKTVKSPKNTDKAKSTTAKGKTKAKATTKARPSTGKGKAKSTAKSKAKAKAKASSAVQVVMNDPTGAKVLLCTSEALPYMTTGGLADVMGSLPHALVDNNIDCRVVMPLYGAIPEEVRCNLTFVKSIGVPLSWRVQHCGIFQAKVGRVTYYLLDNEYYFKRERTYGYFDDAERFAFFSKAILEILPHIDFKPDVIHCNDWQTALVPVYYQLFFGVNGWYSGIKTLFTIHNMQYQGMYPKAILGDVFGIPGWNMYLLEWGDSINLVKGAIECSHWVSTVSETYSHEILEPCYSHGLHDVLRQRRFKLSGILNGIDQSIYSPLSDSHLYANFTQGNIEGKIANKVQLQQRLGLDVDADVPLVGMVSRLTSYKGLELVCQSLEDMIANTDCQLVVLGRGEQQYEEYLLKMQEKYPNRVAVTIGFVPELSRKIYAGSDMFLMPSKTEPCGLSQMIALRYGSIPIVRQTGGLRDSVQDCVDGLGNGFTFYDYNAQEMLEALYSAVDMYHHYKSEWDELVSRAMDCDNSWEQSAKLYIKLYEELIAM